MLFRSSLTYPCASRYRVGDLLNTASIGPRVVESQINLFSAVFVNVVLSICYLFILVALSPWLLVAAVFLGFLLTQFQARIIPILKNLSLRASQFAVELSSKIAQDIQGLRLIHSSGVAQEASDELEADINSLSRVMRRQIFVREILMPMTTFFPILGITVIAGLSVIVFGTKSTGVLPSLVTFVLALQRLNQRFASVASCFSQLAANSGSIQRLDELLQADDKQFRTYGGVPFTGLTDSIEIKNVVLSYSDDNPPALNNVSVSLVRGSTVALVGSSGSGKSSLADLLVGLYEPSKGIIRIDGRPMNDYDLTTWQKRIGVVSQDTFLFNDTLANNISYGSFNCTHADIVRAAEQIGRAHV